MKPEDIENVGVVGGGMMGFGIAINFALNGYPTVIQDVSDDVLSASRKNIRAALDLFVEEQHITREHAAAADERIAMTTDLAELASRSDFVTEAIVERLADKQELFNRLDALCPPHTILVSNTSYHVVSEIGAGVKRQDKIGLTHYFAPPHIVPGVEVARAPGTSDETYGIVYDLMKRIGKIPIRVLKEKSGYLLNRLQGAMAREALQLWAEGLATFEEIELGVRTTFGFRMPHEGPLYHHDLSGIWRWPEDAGNPRRGIPDPPPPDAVAEKMRARMAERKPWFVEPERLDEALEKRDREYIRRLKTLYGSDE
ncbi:MAG: 3-hydroxyacyl-CoA dehydrogenase family protein [Candidatus Latescibacteria bacterium]|jgi:3-hydroxybutyryl-CoA dehydrogenase|nr:3-hydroxyacyl-CoA dehydrogenase family protein [Candidatus Latescibacterota bacterium]